MYVTLAALSQDGIDGLTVAFALFCSALAASTQLFDGAFVYLLYE